MPKEQLSQDNEAPDLAICQAPVAPAPQKSLRLPPSTHREPPFLQVLNPQDLSKKNLRLFAAEPNDDKSRTYNVVATSDPEWFLVLNPPAPFCSGLQYRLNPALGTVYAAIKDWPPSTKPRFGCCVACGNRAMTSVHHLKPVTGPESHKQSNLIRLCIPCHDRAETLGYLARAELIARLRAMHREDPNAWERIM